MDRSRNITRLVWCFKYPIFLLLLIVLLASTAYNLTQESQVRYQTLLSAVIFDRRGTPLTVAPNKKGHYVYRTDTAPEEFKNLLLAKEDRFFYYHPGINPLSTLKALIRHFKSGTASGGSTITQQLTKNLLGHEQDRTFYNKFQELAYALSLELFTSKEEILTMYLNVVYLGNQIQGFETGSQAYFNKPLKDTSLSEQAALLATLSHPNTRNPWKDTEAIYAKALLTRIYPKQAFVKTITTKAFAFQKPVAFELASANISCVENCTLSIDNAITETIREMVQRHLKRSVESGARSSAVVVIDPKTSELIAFVGSQDPSSNVAGDQINMALEPRPIGSTIKPLLYLKGFMSGLRPYTKVEDREYKYPIATGFSLYPKNYDGTYHGTVTLHTALSNSLNVPSVKVLEYIGLSNFYTFLSQDLQFKPLRDLDSYQYGIALGGLEMDLMTLTHYFTLFPRAGTIAPLKLLSHNPENFSLPPQSSITKTLTIAEPKFTELVHAIISDRLTGVDQFGLKSNLNIETTGFGVKTGTSRDFHDSWVVGYTADYVVGVWLGNTENEPLKQITGQSGAGAIWHDVMNFLLTTNYTTNKSIALTDLNQFSIEGSLEWGLYDDEIIEKQQLLQTDTIILNPHQRDTFAWFTDMTIPLRSSRVVSWDSNGTKLGTAAELSFKPLAAGTYELTATDSTTNKREIITIVVTNSE